MKTTIFFKAGIAYAGLVIATATALAAPPQPGEAPDMLVRHISEEVFDAAKADVDIQRGNREHIENMLESRVFPYVDFGRMTSIVAGNAWRSATPDQRAQLTAEFRTLMTHTYVGEIALVSDQKLEFEPLRADPEDFDVEVRTRVVPAHGDPVALNFRLARRQAEWKIYDFSIFGASQAITYKKSFAAEVEVSGIDGLIRTLAKRNHELADGMAK